MCNVSFIIQSGLIVQEAGVSKLYRLQHPVAQGASSVLLGKTMGSVSASLFCYLMF
jgi:hypothetical protein